MAHRTGGRKGGRKGAGRLCAPPRPFTPSFLDPPGVAVFAAREIKRGQAMQLWEYKVVPAPVRGEKERGLKTGAARFAHALGLMMNELAAEGWEYWRAETLPAEERTGLTSKATVYHNLMVFRRPLENAAPRRARAELVHDDENDAPAPERRAFLSTRAPEGRAPRLGPAAEDPEE